MSVVPVQMAGQIFLDSSWQSTWAPVIAASLSGVVTVVATLFIVTWANKTTLGAIKEANDKSLSEMKDAIENSKEIAEQAIIENRKLEEKRLLFLAKKERLEKLTEAASMYLGYAKTVFLYKKVEGATLACDFTCNLMKARANLVFLIAPAERKLLESLPENLEDGVALEVFMFVLQEFLFEENEKISMFDFDKISDPVDTNP